MPKRKYTQAERERLGIGSSKRKSRSADRGSYRADFYDWDEGRDRRRSADDDRPEGGDLGWVGAIGVVLAILVAMDVILR